MYSVLGSTLSQDQQHEIKMQSRWEGNINSAGGFGVVVFGGFFFFGFSFKKTLKHFQGTV